MNQPVKDTIISNCQDRLSVKDSIISRMSGEISLLELSNELKTEQDVYLYKQNYKLLKKRKYVFLSGLASGLLLGVLMDQ